MLTKMSNLQQRVVTAGIAIPLVILLIVFGKVYGVGLLVGLAVVGLLKEFQGMFLSLEDKEEKNKFGVITGLFLVFINVLMPKAIFPCLMISIFLFSLYYLFTANRHPQKLKEHLNEYIYSLFGIIYFVGLMLFLITIRDLPNGVHYVILFLIICWTTDTAGYFAGRAYGKRKLYELISPKKSIEGALAGILFSFVITLIYKLTIFDGISWFFVISGAPIVSAFSQLGDLLESMMKRAIGVKDSGSILPGHGGIMDRLDGMIFSAPVMYYFVNMLG